MLRSIYGKMTCSERELVVKLIVCTILSTLFSWAAGEPYSPTTAVTANLFLYVDRGYIGSIRYAIRRITVQVIQGIFVWLVIAPCKYWLNLPIADPILIIIASCTALAIGLPINYRHTYSPLNCTLANATFILACSIVHNFSAFPYRVIYCIAGFVIGYFVNYILMPQRNRYTEAVTKAQVCTNLLFSNPTSHSYWQIKKLLEIDLFFLKEDNQIRGVRQSHTPEVLLRATLLVKLLNCAESFKSKNDRYNSVIDKDTLDLIHYIFDIYSLFHMELITKLANRVTTVPSPPDIDIPLPNTQEEVLIISCLIDYSNLLMEFVKSYTPQHNEPCGIKYQAGKGNAHGNQFSHQEKSGKIR